MLLFGLIVVVWCSSYGAWQLAFPQGENCDLSSTFHSATFFTPKCVPVRGYSYYFKCDNEYTNMNITMEIYHGEYCSGPPVDEYTIAPTEKCYKDPNEEVMELWKCMEQYKPDFEYLHLSIPAFINQSDVGSSTNPIVAVQYAPIADCLQPTIFKHHTTLTCDKSTNTGEIKFYEFGLCLIRTHKIEMKPGGIYNVGKTEKKDIYVRFDGCGSPSS